MGAGGAVAAVLIFVCCFAFLGSVAIAEVILGVRYLNSAEDCIPADGYLLGLAEWNLILGSVSLFTLSVTFLFGGCMLLCRERNTGKIIAGVVLIVIVVISSIFSIVWFGIGVAILIVANNEGCATKPLEDITIAALVFLALGICNNVVSSRNRNNK
jgi:hypothetical protein